MDNFFFQSNLAGHDIFREVTAFSCFVTAWGGRGLHCDKWAWLEGPLRRVKLSNEVIDKSLISRIPESPNCEFVKNLDMKNGRNWSPVHHHLFLKNIIETELEFVK